MGQMAISQRISQSQGLNSACAASSRRLAVNSNRSLGVLDTSPWRIACGAILTRRLRNCTLRVESHTLFEPGEERFFLSHSDAA